MAEIAHDARGRMRDYVVVAERQLPRVQHDATANEVPSVYIWSADGRPSSRRVTDDMFNETARRGIRTATTSTS